MSEDQTIDEFDGDHVTVTATVRDSAQFDWWLFPDTIEASDEDDVIVTATMRAAAKLEWWARWLGDKVVVHEPDVLCQRY